MWYMYFSCNAGAHNHIYRDFDMVKIRESSFVLTLRQSLSILREFKGTFHGGAVTRRVPHPIIDYNALISLLTFSIQFTCVELVFSYLRAAEVCLLVF